MPENPTYPGVYIEEMPSGVRTIVGVSTSVAAVLGAFRRGPLDTPLQLFDIGDLDREFGGLWPADEAGYALTQFFSNGGSNAWVVRVAGDGSPLRAASVTLQDAGATDAIVATAGRRVRGRSVDDPGIWGDNVRLVVDHDTRDPADANLFNLAVAEMSRADGRRGVERRERYADLSTQLGAPDDAIEKVNESSELVQLVAATTPFARPAQNGTTGTPVTPAAVFGPESTLNVHLDGGPPLVLTLATLAAGTTFAASPAAVRRGLARALRVAGTIADEPALARATVANQGGSLRVLAGGGNRADFDPSTIITFTENGQTTAADLGLLGAVANVQEYVLGGTGGFQSNPVTGADGAAPDQAALIGDFDDNKGLYALRDVDLFNILLIPGAVAPHMSDDDAGAVYAAAEEFCEAERAFLVVDVPAGIDEVAAVRDWVDDRNIRHRNAAVYYPRLHVSDPLADGQLRSIGPSGTMAGVYARTDAERGVWKAPAGSDAVLRNVQGFDTALTDSEIGQLNPVAINALREFPTYGRVAWGARTLDGADVRASQWKYVPVRRFALYLEESLSRGLQWVVFEPNDEPLWSQIRLNVGAFMHGLFREGAFAGASPRETCFVKCDSETTTQHDIDQGIVYVVVGFAPLEPAEFVIIRIRQTAGQVQS